MAQKQLNILAVLNGRIDNSFTNLGSAITSLGTMVNTVSQPLINLGKEGLETYATYEQNMKDAEGALSSSYDSTYELNTVMEGLDESAQQWAASTRFTTEDVSLAISEAAHAGYDYEQILKTMPQTMLLAQAGNLDLSTSLDYVIKSTNALGMDLDDLGTFIDQWAMGANSSATTIDEFGQAMLRMGSTMQFADSTEELFTLLAVLANTGTTGSNAGTLLRNTMLRLIAPTKNASKAMAQLGDVSDEEMAELQGDSEQLQLANELLEGMGWSAYDAQGNLKPMLQIFKEIFELTKNMDENEMNTIIGTMFPTRTITGALNLLEAAAEDYDGLYEQIADSAGYAGQVSEIQMDSLSGKTKIFESKVEELKRSIGEVLAPQVEAGESFLGQFIDKLNELDDDKLTMLVNGLEGIAIAGPAMITLGTFARLVSFIPAPAGIAAASIMGIATALGAVRAYNDITIEENFGTVSLDIDTLKKSLDSLGATDEENKFAGLDAYIGELQGYANDYQTAASTFSQQITIAGVTNTTLDTTQQSQLKQLGMSMIASVQSGIETGRSYYLTALGHMFADDTDPLTGETTVPDEDYEIYSEIYDSINKEFGNLETEAETLQSQFSACLAKIFNDDGTINDAAAAEAQEIIEKMNEVEAKIMNFDIMKRDSAMLRKSQTVSLESWEEYMDTIEEYQQEDIDAINQHYDNVDAATRMAWDEEQAKLGKGPISDEDWLKNRRHLAIEGERQESLQPTYDKYGGYAAEGFNNAMEQSEFADTWAKLLQIQAGARDENGNFDFNKVNIEDYFSSEKEASDFINSLETMTIGGGIDSILSGDTRLSEMIEDFRFSDQVAPLFEAINTIVPGLIPLLETYRFTGGQEAVEQQYAADSASNMSMWAEIGEEPPQYQKPEVYGPPTPTESQLEQGKLQVQSVSEEGLSATVTQVEAAEGVTLEGLSATVDSVTFAGPMPQDVDMGEAGTMNAQAGVTGTAEAASEAHSELQGAMDAAGDITTSSSISNTAEAAANGHNELQLYIDAMGNVHFNGEIYNKSELPAEIAAAVNSGSPYQFTAQAHIIGMPTGGIGRVGGFASGGRTETVSYFGEAGPEWAIPEEHSANTASLIAQVMRATGFVPSDFWAQFPDDASAPTEETAYAQLPIQGMINGYSADDNAPAAVQRTDSTKQTEPFARLKAYASGGRAGTPSLFGEAGPEWAIPEEHSANTANLINQTIQASGFDWDELYSMFAGDHVPDAPEAPQPMSPETISAVTGLEGLVGLIDSLLPPAGYGAQTSEDAEPLQLPALPAFAEGGRTSEPSLFGESGPEWAIPERHSSATAMLIDQARSASGFSWDELQSVSGDTSNTSTASTTLVYSPTIVANDATDVESKLREDKARLQEQMERWWRDRETREQLEVYAT